MPFAVTLRCPPDEAEFRLAESIGFDTSGIEQLEDGIRAHFESRAEAERFAAEVGGEIETIEARNWAEEWQRQWRPVEVGRRFYLSPPWMPGPAPTGRIRLEMRPGLVFGGGDHATTQLCLELLEDYLRPGDALADIGCGSGILMDGAAALGAGTLAGCDIDWNAAWAAGQILNARARPALAFQGSASALRSGRARIVTANLLTGVVGGLLPEFARILEPGGILIASGYLDTQRDLLTAITLAAGFDELEQRARDGWAAGAFRYSPRGKATCG